MLWCGLGRRGSGARDAVFGQSSDTPAYCYNAAMACGRITLMARTGAAVGRQQSRKPSSWTPGDSRLFRPGPAFRDKDAEKVWRALELTGVSASTLFLKLIRDRMPVDAEGYPLDENGRRLFVDDTQQELPMTG
jgi:hypothetical protein